MASPDLRSFPDRGSRHLVVIVPCLDEERTVGDVVAAVPASIPGVARVSVLVVDDGSHDGTAAAARAAGAEVLRHERNQGLGVSFRDGVAWALSRGADLAVNIDGDGQFDASDIATLVAPVVDGSADMVTASRFVDRALTPRMPWAKRWGNHAVAAIVSLLTGRRFHDVSCGFRAFSRRALLEMNLFGSFTYTQETFLDLVFKGLEILEVPLPVRGVREFGTSRIASSLLNYAHRSSRIMMRAFLSYRPLAFFASLASVFVVVAVSLLGFLFLHWRATGAFSPHIWAGFVGGSFGFLGIITLVIGLVGDMLVRLRMNQERILVELRKAGSEPPDDRAAS